MNFSIATTTDNATEQTVSFIKSGDRFIVSLRNPKAFQTVDKFFFTQSEAAEAYTKIVSAFLSGTYSWAARMAILNNRDEIEE